MASEPPTLADVLAAVRSLTTDAYERFDAVHRRFDAIDRRFDATDERIQTLDRKVDTVHGIVRQVQREAAATHGLVQTLIDAHAMFRQEYLREHPGGGHA